MKKFSFLIVRLIFFCIAALYLCQEVFDRSYDLITRSKIDWIMKEDSTKYDFVFIGSSRCIHHVNPLTFDSLGYTSINYGYASVGPRENLLLTRLILKNRNVKTLVVQIDESQSSQFDDLAHIPFLPHEESLIGFKDSLYSQYLYYRIPYFKYIKNNQELGLRNVIMGLFNKNPSWVNKKGFVPLIAEGISDIGFETSKEQKLIHVAHEYLEIEKLCKTKDVNLIFFTAPILQSPSEFQFGFTSADYMNYSDSLQFSNFYKDRIHLNSEGAQEFTNMLVKQLCHLSNSDI